MNFKSILIDGDGVAIKKRELFSTKFSREYNVPIDKIIPFFKKEFKLCQLGKEDLKVALPPYLEEWGWQESIDDFLKYWFESDTIADEEILDRIQEIRSKGIKCYLVTDQEKYRAENIRKNLEFGEKLDDCFFSCEVGYSKEEPEFFQKLSLQRHRRFNFYKDHYRKHCYRFF